MCPFTVDEAQVRDPLPGEQRGDTRILMALDPHRPPTKSIPHGEFPRVVYKHPREPFKTIEHRNARHELVEEEIVHAEHLTKAVSCAAHEGHQGPIVACEDCAIALKKAIAEGWQTKPFIPPPLPDRNAGLYDAKPKRQAQE